MNAELPHIIPAGATENLELTMLPKVKGDFHILFEFLVDSNGELLTIEVGIDGHCFSDASEQEAAESKVAISHE